MIEVEIDKDSGFCFGVVTAIESAERELGNTDTLYCLGDIVHNSLEVERLEHMGLHTIDHEGLSRLRDRKVLLRAHGEPPSTYALAKRNNITIIDATCPVVLRLQRKIHKCYQETRANNTQLVIYGKKGHAEVEYFNLGVNPIFRDTYTLGGGTITIKGYNITEKCIGCGKCRTKCPQRCIEEGKPYRIQQNHCLHCGNCYENCPVKAIVRE